MFQNAKDCCENMRLWDDENLIICLNNLFVPLLGYTTMIIIERNDTINVIR